MPLDEDCVALVGGLDVLLAAPSELPDPVTDELRTMPARDDVVDVPPDVEPPVDPAPGAQPMTTRIAAAGIQERAASMVVLHVAVASYKGVRGDASGAAPAGRRMLHPFACRQELQRCNITSRIGCPGDVGDWASGQQVPCALAPQPLILRACSGQLLRSS